MTTMRTADDRSDRYVFDNDNVHAVEQHRVLPAMLDGFTTARLARLGVAPGWRCLEVGAGGGSVAHWLAERVAPTGSVLATDIKPGHIRPGPGVTPMVHDIVTDPLPDNAFELICSRLVLLHLPQRLAVLDRLVGALRPGGWLQLDEFDISYGPALLMPDARSRELYETFLAAKREIMRRAGADGAWGQRIGQAMRDAGLADVDVDVRVEVLQADSPGTRLLVHHSHHLRDRFLEVGLTDADLAEVRALLADPSFRATSCAVYSAQGRRPGRD